MWLDVFVDILMLMLPSDCVCVCVCVCVCRLELMSEDLLLLMITRHLLRLGKGVGACCHTWH